MKILERLDKVNSKARENERVKINEAIILLSEYVTLVGKKNFKAHLNSKRNNSKTIKMDKLDIDEINKKYQLCLGKIKELNKLSEKYSEENIYKGDFSKKDIEEFILQLSNEVFDNRSISRR